MKKRMIVVSLIGLFLSLSINTFAQTWEQIGADIDGEAAIDNFGQSVSYSADGSTVAVGAHYNDGNGTSSGHVRVFKKVSGAWQQIGADIDGEAEGDQSGWVVSLNSDGTIVAIGAQYNDGNGSNSGHVRVYENNGGTWQQIGADIDGEAANDQSGSSVSINSDGSIVAVGAVYNDGNGSDAGHVKVYENNGGNWQQLGANINGELAGDQSGSSICLSGDGLTIAIGAIGNDGGGSYSGHVRVWYYVVGNWIQKGSDIDGEAVNDQSGYSVSLSSNATTVAIGAPMNDGNGSSSGHVRVYKYSGNWSQIGADIDGETLSDYCGWSVGLNSDGTVVAVSIDRNDDNGTDAGQVKVFQNVSDSWVQRGIDINGEAAADRSGYSVSINSDGSEVAVGAPYNDGNGSGSGHVRIYKIIIWEQNGNDIDGEAADDHSGLPVTISGDGSTVAVGAYRNDGNGTDAGHVRVFRKVGETWTQIGADIDGEAAGDYCGKAISLNYDGSIIAVGSTLNDGGGGNSGHVRIFYYNIGSWTQLGANIEGEAVGDNSGNSVSLSADGSIVAIGAALNDGTATGAGHVRIYQYSIGSWSQIGNDIEGEAANDYSGNSVSLSADGSIVAVGAIQNDGNGDISGHVRIYQYTTGSWSQIGSDIDGEAAGDMSGCSVSLSSDGSKVAIGAFHNSDNGTDAGHIRVFYNNADTWTQVGNDIDGEAASDFSGFSVSISSSGSVVAIGAYGNDGNGGMSGHVRVFRNDEDTWTQMGEDIDGEGTGDYSGESISLSANGLVLAIGAKQNDGNGTSSGHVRVYKIPMKPIVTNQPGNQTDICVGAEAAFMIDDEFADTYQWQVSTNSGGSWSDLSDNTTYSGTLTNTLTVTTGNSLNNYLYQCNLTNEFGNSTSDNAILTVETEDPTVTCISNQEVTADATHSYTVSGTEFDPATTDDNCGVETVINDFNSSETLAGDELPEGLTTIVWTVTDGAGNDAFCSFDVTVNAYVEIEELKQKNISIYPNPTAGIFKLEGPDNIQEILITEIFGKTVKQLKVNNEHITIDISDRPGGIYFLHIKTDTDTFITKIVKE